MDALSQIQHDIANLLLGDPALADVPVTTFKEMVIADILASESLAPWTDRSGQGKIGTAIQVRIPTIRAVTSNVPGPQLVIEQTIRIWEDPVNNTTGLTAEAIGLEVLDWLDGQRFEGLNVELIADTKQPALQVNESYPDRFTYDCTFISPFPRDYQLARVISPVLSDDDAGTVTITCSDGAATIYRSIDGSLPVIGDVTKVYHHPFTVPAGTVVRAFAWRAGCLPSYIQQATVLIP